MTACPTITLAFISNAKRGRFAITFEDGTVAAVGDIPEKFIQRDQAQMDLYLAKDICEVVASSRQWASGEMNAEQRPIELRLVTNAHWLTYASIPDWHPGVGGLAGELAMKAQSLGIQLYVKFVPGKSHPATPITSSAEWGQGKDLCVREIHERLMQSLPAPEVKVLSPGDAIPKPRWWRPILEWIESILVVVVGALLALSIYDWIQRLTQR